MPAGVALNQALDHHWGDDLAWDCGVLPAWSFVFVLSLKELNTSILLVTPSSNVLSTLIYDVYQEGSFASLSALVRIQAVMAAVALALHRSAQALPCRLWYGGRNVSLESVRKVQTGLQSFRSMRRIEARRKKARPLRLRFSQSLASLRQRLSQAMVRSTIQRLGRTVNPLP